MAGLPARGRGLVAEVERWAVDAGCGEPASDAELSNTARQALHASLGFEVVERVVFFRKRLP